MFCPTCQTAVWATSDVCPTCGGTMRAVAAGDTVEVVEATMEMCAEEADKAGDVVPLDMGTLTVTSRPVPTISPMRARLAELSVAAWRQPAVRAAIKTGASAVALSLVMRTARRMLIRPAAHRAVSRAMLPSLADLFASDTPDGHQHGATMVETFIYVRRMERW